MSKSIVIAWMVTLIIQIFSLVGLYQVVNEFPSGLPLERKYLSTTNQLMAAMRNGERSLSSAEQIRILEETMTLLTRIQNGSESQKKVVESGIVGVLVAVLFQAALIVAVVRTKAREN